MRAKKKFELSKVSIRNNVVHSVTNVLCPDGVTRYAEVTQRNAKVDSIQMKGIVRVSGFSVSGMIIRTGDGSYSFTPHPWGRNANAMSPTPYSVETPEKKYKRYA